MKNTAKRRVIGQGSARRVVPVRPRHMRLRAVGGNRLAGSGGWLFLVVAAVLGCSSAEVPPAAAADRFAGTVGIVSGGRAEGYPATLRDVRVGDHGAYQRVVFDFGDSPLPGYHLEYVDKPLRQCGSGDALPVAGDGWLRVRFTPAYAHTEEEGRPTIADRNRRMASGNIRQLMLTCDFEAMVEWVIGVGSPNPFRVLELTNPSRLVVDVGVRRK